MFNKPKQFYQIIAGVVVILGFISLYSFYGKSDATKASSSSVTQNNADAVVSAVGKLVELPAGETPTVATVSDIEKLKGQSFFNDAQNGDTLLAYNKALVAILYRPQTNKIINMAKVSASQPQPQNSPVVPDQATSTPASLRIAYYNGTKTIGRAALAEKAVKEKYSSSQTASLINASKRDYTKTLVVDLSGHNSEVATNIAVLLKGKVGPLPVGETAPDADILIISGQ